jgi:hypothetical protein
MRFDPEMSIVEMALITPFTFVKTVARLLVRDLEVDEVDCSDSDCVS